MRKTKILTLVLTLALLITSAVMITAMADTTPTVEVVSKNLSYEDNIRLLFAVKSENAGDAVVKLNVYESDPTDNAELSPKEVVSPAYKESINSYGECDVFFTTGIAAKYLQKQVYVQAEVTVNEVTYKSEVERYSIVEYCHEMIAKESTDAEKDAKYMNVIEYGAAIQSFLADDTDSDGNPKYSGAYATDYKYVTIDGGTLDGRYDTGIYLAGDKVKPYAEGAEFWSDGGSVVANNTEYTVGDSNVSFTAASAKDLATVSFDGLTSLPTGVTSESTHPTIANVSNSYSTVTPSIQQVNGSDALYVAPAYNTSKAILKFGETATAQANATTVEFEADLMINWGSNSTNAEFFNLVFADANGTVAYNLVFRLTSTSGNLGIAHRTTEGGLYGFNQTFISGGDNTLETTPASFNLRVTYTYTDGALTVNVYKDGTFVNEITLPATPDKYVDEANITNAYIIVNGRGSGHVINCQVGVDNVVFRKIAE